MSLVRSRLFHAIAACTVLMSSTFACSDDDAAASPTVTASEDGGMTNNDGSTGMSEAGPAAKKDIVDTALAAGTFNTLAELVTAAGLGGTLKGAGPFTVLAPTDAAFAKLPADVVNLLKKPENKSILQQVLTYHVIAGTARAADVVKLSAAASVEGENLRIAASGADVTINPEENPAPFASLPANKAKVTQADIEATNGVIHVLDAVLIPPTVLAMLDPNGKDIVETAVAAGSFTSLAGALTKAELVATLKGPGPFTVFAPTDAAFAKLGDTSGLTKDQLTPILTYHVVNGLVGSAAVVAANGKEVEAVSTKKFKIKVAGTKVSLTDGKGTDVGVTMTDIATKNGLIHVIDTVLSPP